MSKVTNFAIKAVNYNNLNKLCKATKQSGSLRPMSITLQTMLQEAKLHQGVQAL